MEIVENLIEPKNVQVDEPDFSPTKSAQDRQLLKILGVGFGVAVGIGGTIGVGILRNPSGVAAQLGSFWTIMLVWSLGGVYCLLGANYLTELTTMVPKAGGFYVYAERAFGRFGGFVVGWSDWLNNTLGLSFISVVFGEYAANLFAPNLTGGRIIFSVSIIVVVAMVNLIGLRSGSETQKITSFLKAAALVFFVIACFSFGGQKNQATQGAVFEPTSFSSGLVAFVLAFQLVLGTYDGWYSAIYFSEEDTNPKNNLPRSIFGGIVSVMAIYLLVTLALLYVLPISQLATSKFAGGDAMSLIFGGRSRQLVTILALLSLIGIINAILMMAPRIMFALGRDGQFSDKATLVNKGGTPFIALMITASCAVVLSSVGTFELLLAIGQFFMVVITILLIVALFILRRKEPDTPRPFRAWAYPIAPLLMLVCAVLLFFGYIVSNPYPSLYALIFLALSYPLFRLKKADSIHRK